MDAELPINPDCPNCLKMKAWIEETLLKFESRIRDLEDELKKYKSQDKPPRPQEPIPPPAKKAPTGKKPGGQAGHKGTARKWLSKECVTETVAFVPKQCVCCQAKLSKEQQPGDPDPTIYQTYELPEQLVDVSLFYVRGSEQAPPTREQFEGHYRTCSNCQTVNHHAIPQEKLSGILGPRLSAMILHQSGVLGISKRDIEELLKTVFELPISLGLIAKLEQEASNALKVEHEAIRKEVNDAPIKGFDETGWKEAGKKRWLWVCAIAKAVLFSIHPRRNLKALNSMISNRKGIVITDRWKTYNHWPIEKRQPEHLLEALLTRCEATCGHT